MTYATVCSGIEAPTVAWEPLGWQPAWFSEIAKFPCRVLQHHYPHVPNYGDMTQLLDTDAKNTPIDLLAGGTPCQSFSIAGLRQGLADPRGNLALEFLRLVDNLRPRWVLWENVPGVLSSNKGGDFAAFLWALGQLGYGWAYRILDAQYVGVPQQRRRVFVVAHIGGRGPAAGAVLFESKGLRGNFTPREKAEKEIASTLTSSPGAGSGLGTDFDLNGGVVPTLVSSCQPGNNNNTVGQLVSGAVTSKWAKGGGLAGDEHYNLVAHALTAGIPDGLRGQDPGVNLVNANTGVRRLTPLECERLQGFPDNYTRVATDKAGTKFPITPRYVAIGNSMAVPVVRWIGERIQAVDNIMEGQA